MLVIKVFDYQQSNMRATIVIVGITPECSTDSRFFKAIRNSTGDPNVSNYEW